MPDPSLSNALKLQLQLGRRSGGRPQWRVYNRRLAVNTVIYWEGIRQVRATLLGARHVPERLRGGCVYLRRYIKCSTFTFIHYFSRPRTHNLPIVGPTRATSSTVSIPGLGRRRVDSAQFTSVAGLCKSERPQAHRSEVM